MLAADFLRRVLAAIPYKVHKGEHQKGWGNLAFWSGQAESKQIAS